MSRGGGGGCGIYLVFMAALLGGGWIYSEVVASEPLTVPKQNVRPNVPTLVHWQPVSMACADGWSFPTGFPGACSNHGGVEVVWRDGSGREVTCRNSPPSTEGTIETPGGQPAAVVC
jgi:hypothetical protein